MFTKQRVPQYAGHTAAAAQTVVEGWGKAATVNLDTECRTLTFRTLTLRALYSALTSMRKQTPWDPRADIFTVAATAPIRARVHSGPKHR